MNKLGYAITTLIAATLMTGCVQYQLVERSADGATYRLMTPDHSIPPKMQQEVKAACGGDAKVVSEGEVVVGTVSQTDARASESFGVAYGSASTDTTDKTEWRVEFACVDKQTPPEASSAAPETSSAAPTTSSPAPAASSAAPKGASTPQAKTK